MPDSKIIGNHIKELRRKYGITQKELAKRIGKTESSVQKYEAGSVEIPFSVLDKIAIELKTTVSSLTSLSISELIEISALSFLKQPEKKEIVKLLSTIGYEIYELDEGKYEIFKEYNSIIVTNNELENLYSTFKDFMAYTVDKFFTERRKT